jgi:hypothetical protein
MTNGPVVVVLGMTSYAPYAGVSWQTAQYLEGFRRLGYDVYYVEDHGYWPFNPLAQVHADDCTETVRFISDLMARFGLEDRWAYRDVASDGRVFGLSAARFADLLENADVLVNLTGSTVLEDRHMRVPVRVYLETDPVLGQIEIATGNARTRELLDAHTHHATYAENLGAPDCDVPVRDYAYIPTRPPVVIDWWTPLDPDPHAPYTTVSSWEQTFKDVVWNGETYTWSKHFEFLRLIDLPAHAPHGLELALATSDSEVVALLHDHGWSVVDAQEVSGSLERYREYVRGSWGEFTVAKEQNVRLRSGWFSDRSACYLAAGRPVITQDTGFGNVLPTGEGLFAFRDRDDVLAAFAAVEAEPERHRRAGREIAESWFRAESVLAELMAAVDAQPPRAPLPPTAIEVPGDD